MRRAWTAREIRTLKRQYAALGPRRCAKLLRRSRLSVHGQARKLGLRTDRFMTAADLQFIRDHYRRMPTAAIAQLLHRTIGAIYNAVFKLGLMHRRTGKPGLAKLIRAKLRAGWSDEEISQEWTRLHPDDGCTRKCVSKRRQRMGLAPSDRREHYRKRVAAKTKEQLAKAGLPSIGWLRRRAYQNFCARMGWPMLTRPRAAQICNALWTLGPMNRRQLAAACGMRWKGSRHSLRSNDEEGSYLAHLIARGLVVVVGGPGRRQHTVAGRGSGYSQCVYSIAPGVVRQLPATGAA